MSHAEVATLPVAPTPPDEGPLVDYIRAMPGGTHIEPHWRDEPLHLVAVDVDEVRWALQAVCAAFPPYAHDRRHLVFCVPATVADILTWNSEEGAWWAESDANVLQPELTAQVAAIIWDSDTQADEVISNAEQLLDVIPEEVDPISLARAVATLVADGADFEEAVDAAAAIFADHDAPPPM